MAVQKDQSFHNCQLQVNQQTLRIVAFSPTNSPFTGNDGEIVAIKFNLIGASRTYDVGLSNVTISNAIGTNILTGYFPGYIKITAPDIVGLTTIDFGEVSVVDTISYDYQLSNTGNDTLFIVTKMPAYAAVPTPTALRKNDRLESRRTVFNADSSFVRSRLSASVRGPRVFYCEKHWIYAILLQRGDMQVRSVSVGPDPTWGRDQE